jgi:succinate dehydrogenase subunit C
MLRTDIGSHAQPHVYTPYHPRWLRQQVSTYWWVQKPSYFAFILRELSCLFVAWFVVYLLMLVRAINQGEVAYQDFIAGSAGTGMLLVNLVGFGFIVYHAITFFIAAPQALVVHVGRKRLSSGLVGGAHYLGWIVVSAVVAWVLLGA